MTNDFIGNDLLRSMEEEERVLYWEQQRESGWFNFHDMAPCPVASQEVHAHLLKKAVVKKEHRDQMVIYYVIGGLVLFVLAPVILKVLLVFGLVFRML